MDPLAIVGIGCRLPGASGPEEFWELLRSGTDVLDRKIEPRWLGQRFGGFLDNITDFDNEFFGLSAREAKMADPQQRIVAEVAVEALDDAAIGLAGLRSTQVAVVLGASSYEHGARVVTDPDLVGPFSITGSALSIVANRLSYMLDLRGPSIVVDTACSSSLVALASAARILDDPQIPLALVGGVNLVLTPYIGASFATGGFLAADGRCKTFDSAADGYVRSEGCAVVVVKRLADARAAGDRVYATVLGIAVNSDGRSNGLHAPNRFAQEAVIRSAWAAAGREPSDASYVECHGTGTPLGDTIEVDALNTVFAPQTRDTPLLLGSVKTNLGHLEAAAGIAGLIKTALALHHRMLPASLHLREANPMLRLRERGMDVVVTATPWADGTPLAGLSSFGFGGTNAHAVLGEGDWVRQLNTHAADTDSTPVLMPLTAYDVGRLRGSARRWQSWLESPAGAVPIADIAHTAVRRQLGDRADEIRRGAVVAATTNETAQALAALAAGIAHTAVAQSAPGGPCPPALLFVYPGQGGQFVGMGRLLAQDHSAFHAAAMAASAAIAAAGGPPVWSDQGFAATGTVEVQCAVFAHQVATTALLAEWGVRPDAVVGHSLGEVAAAHAAGALSLSDAARVVVERSQVLSLLDGGGAMLLVELPYGEALDYISEHAATVGVAAVNGPSATVLSGDLSAIARIRADLRRDGLFHRTVAVNFAAHSPQVDPLVAMLVGRLDGIAPVRTDVAFVSTVRSGAVLAADELGPSYWGANMRDTVHLHAAMLAAPGGPGRQIVEVSPHPVLARSIIEMDGEMSEVLASADRDDERRALLCALGRLYAAGRDLAWPQTVGRRVVSLPNRAWVRNRFELVTRIPRESGSARGADDATTSLLGEPVWLIDSPGEFVAPVRLDDVSLDDHIVEGRAVVPAAAWLQVVADAGLIVGATVVDLKIHRRCTLADARAGTVQLRVRRGQGRHRVAITVSDPGSVPDLLVSALLIERPESEAPQCVSAPDIDEVGADGLYAALASCGLAYGPSFRLVTSVRVDADSAVGDLAPAASPGPGADVAVLDACLHVLAAAAGALSFPDGVVPLPVGTASAWITSGRRPVRCSARVRDRSSSGLTGDVIALDATGDVVVRLAGARIEFALPAAAAATSRLLDGALLEPMWDPVPVVDEPAALRHVVVGRGALAKAVITWLGRDRVAAAVEPEPAAVRAALDVGPRGLVLVSCPGPVGTDAAAGIGEYIAAIVELLREVLLSDVRPAALTAVLPDAASMLGVGHYARMGEALAAGAIAGLLRGLRHEMAVPLRIVHVDDSPGRRPDPGVVAKVIDGAVPAGEFRLIGECVSARGLRVIDTPAQPRLLVESDGVYVVTGGAGALGLTICEHLLERGAGEVVVLSRRATAVPTQFSSRMRALTVDVCDTAAVDRALAVARAGGRAIRGVVHAAGVLEDAPLAGTTPDAVLSVWAPKVIGACNLLNATAADPLEFAVLYGSAAGSLGAPGQIAYVAANSALTALSIEAARQDRPVLTVSWGTWDAGLARSSGGAARLADEGVPPLAPTRGVELFDEAIAAMRPDVTALRVETGQLRGAAAFLSDLLVLGGAAEQAPARAVMRNVTVALSSEPAERRRQLIKYVAKLVAEVVGDEIAVVPADVPFAKLGVTSLLAMDLRRRLEAGFNVALTVSVLFAHPTVERLADELDRRLAPPAIDTGSAVAPLVAPQVTSDTEIEALTDAELLARLEFRVSGKERNR